MARRLPSISRFSLHIFTLCSLAVVQPLFDIVAKNAELLVAKKIDAIDISLLVIALSIVLPALLILGHKLAQSLNTTAALWLGRSIIALLLCSLSLLLTKNVFGPDGAYLPYLAIAIGLGLALLYYRSEAVQQIFSAMSPVVILVPLLFLLNPQVSRTVFNADNLSSVDGSQNADIPVVFLVFDELPLISLLDENAEIDAGRYPNFAELAETSHWFRNAQTVAGVTTVAVPALLSGIEDHSALPILADYPQNLFTLLQPSHELKTREIVTALCPSSACGEVREIESEGLTDDFSGLLSDLSVIYFHLLLPTEYAQNLPVISQSWANFANTEAPANKVSDIDWTELAAVRSGKFADFIDDIHGSDPTSLYFYHALLPHMPWEFTPSGKLYSLRGSAVPGLDALADTWGSNEFLVNQGYQRHLLQLGFVDKLLGDTLDKLKEEGLFDRSLIIVASDHGANFLPNVLRRSNQIENNERDVNGIALFIKEPMQVDADLHDEDATTLDVLPTLAAAMNLDATVPMQGRNLLSDNIQAVAAPRYDYRENQSLRRKLALFGSHTPDGLFRLGENRQLLGHSLDEFEIQPVQGLSAEIEQQAFLRSVELSAAISPSLLSGRILGAAASTIEEIAVALNGEIVALSQPFSVTTSGEPIRFSTLLPDYRFKQGRNVVTLLQIEPLASGGLRLLEFPSQQFISYNYDSSRLNINQLSAGRNTGSGFQLEESAIEAVLDGVLLQDDLLRFNGWAVLNQDSIPAERILIEANERIVFAGDVNVQRGDIVAAKQAPSLLNSGFNFRLPINQLDSENAQHINLIALSEDRATVFSSFTLLLRNNQANAVSTFRFERSARNRIRSRDDQLIELKPEAITGSMDSVTIRNGLLEVSGWTANAEELLGTEYLLLDISGELHFLDAVNLDRPDVAELLANSNLLKSGYSLKIDLALIASAAPDSVRLIAVQGGQASVLNSDLFNNLIDELLR